MNIEKYSHVSKNNHQAFRFISSGPKGSIEKVVTFRNIKEWGENIYNLSFGDWDEHKQNINYQITSNNGDRQKVLATVAAIILEFSVFFPGKYIYFEGSTNARTRLYQMGISHYHSEISKFYDIYGFRQGAWEEFKPGRNFEAFLISQKK
jgi:hypothetical protein